MVLALIILVAVTLVRPAVAGELRILTWHKETSSSRCLGDPKSLTCAFETSLACDIWGDEKLCDSIEEYDPLIRRGPHPVHRAQMKLYEFLDRKTLTDDDATKYANPFNPIPAHAGDVAIRAYLWTCEPDEDCVHESILDPVREPGDACPQTACERDDSPISDIFRKKGAFWILVGGPHGFDFPDEFWNRK